MAEFMALLDPINALAEQAPGFVWRLQTEDGDATAILVFDDERLIINMSVWETIDALAEFVYRSGHIDVLRCRREWFDRIHIYLALWWVPVGHRPTVIEAEERLDHLRAQGPTPFAFTFKRHFLPDAELVIDDELRCPA